MNDDTRTNGRTHHCDIDFDGAIHRLMRQNRRLLIKAKSCPGQPESRLDILRITRLEHAAAMPLVPIEAARKVAGRRDARRHHDGG
jgi:hypothetical protein